MSLRIKRELDELNSCWNIEISGEVDIHTSGNMKDALNEMLDEQDFDLKIDCEKLLYIDSTGLGVLIGILKRVKKSDKNVHIIGAQSNISKLMSITGLDKIFILSEK